MADSSLYDAITTMVILAGVLTLAVKISRIAREPAKNTCSACGYDLRGTLKAGRDECPECGARIEK